jgi:hypothetical protein
MPQAQTGCLHVATLFYPLTGTSLVGQLQVQLLLLLRRVAPGTTSINTAINTAPEISPTAATATSQPEEIGPVVQPVLDNRRKLSTSS